VPDNFKEGMAVVVEAATPEAQVFDANVLLNPLEIRKELSGLRFPNRKVSR
jgi:hypothetical protein